MIDVDLVLKESRAAHFQPYAFCIPSHIKIARDIGFVQYESTVQLQYIAVRYFAKSSISQIGHGSQIFHKQKKKFKT